MYTESMLEGEIYWIIAVPVSLADESQIAESLPTLMPS